MSQSPPTNGFAIIAPLLLILLNTASVKCAPDTTIQKLECNTATWQANDPYGSVVGDALHELVNNGASQPSYVYYIAYNNWTLSVAYGFSYCNTLLVPQDCSACLSIASGTLMNSCPLAMGAVVKMTDCMMRYENYPFNG